MWSQSKEQDNGSHIEIRQIILSKKDYYRARISCSNKEVLFLEQLLEADQLRLMK